MPEFCTRALVDMGFEWGAAESVVTRPEAWWELAVQLGFVHAIVLQQYVFVRHMDVGDGIQLQHMFHHNWIAVQ